MTGITDDALKTALAQGARAIPTVALPDGSIAFLVPEGYETEIIHPVDRPLSKHITANVTVHDADSFAAYVKEFGGDNTRIFAAPGFLAPGSKPTVHAMLDYHAKGVPANNRHSVNYYPRYSDQWNRWVAACKGPMGQAQFAEFIEECRADIIAPEAAQLLDIVRTFKANKNVEFDSVTYQSDSTVKLHYAEEVKQKGVAVLPEKMRIGIPVYFRDARYPVEVFIRFRVGGGGVTFQLKLDRADVVEDEAFKALVEKIEKDTGITSYLGH